MVSAVHRFQQREMIVCVIEILQVTLGSLIHENDRVFNNDSLSHAEYR